ncbi:MAG: LPS export ABC transporter permease LptG [Pseudohongiellaceae bacterium]|nr:LPS export ABC transporter permease LptG [Pseudohongiellaceae bacterium]
MKLLSAHVRNIVLLSMLVVLALIVTMDFLFTLADELGGTNENFTSGDALIYVLRLMPTSIYEMLPFSALGGALVGLGILASQNELVVMQAAGVRTRQLVWLVMKPTIWVMLFSLVLGEYVAPALQQKAQSERAILSSGGVALSSRGGDWRKIGNEFIHINAILPGGNELQGVTRYVVDDRRRLVSSSFSASAQYITDDSSPYWRLYDTQQTLFGNGQIAAERVDVLDWPVDMSPELLSVLLVEPERQSISGLYRFAEYFASQGLESDTYFLAFWKKLLQPLATASLVVLAIGFVFGPLRSATMGARLFVAIGIGLGFTIVQRMLGPASLLYGFSPLFAVLVPIALCLGAGVVLLRRV